MSSRPTVLIGTCSEYGQANVNLATAYELALAGANVHVLSFAPLKDRVSRLEQLVLRHASRSNKTAGPIVFHECKGTPYWDRIRQLGVNDTTMPHPGGLRGASKSYGHLGVLAFPWTSEEYLSFLEQTKDVITTLKPDVVLVESIFYFGMDACALLNQKYMVILPNSIGEVSMTSQPRSAKLWKYPALSSGFKFPLKWWNVPANGYLRYLLIAKFVLSKSFMRVQATRKSFGLEPMYSRVPFPGVRYILPALTEIDWPYAVVPKEIVLCGPIVVPFDPVEESDPALTRWLDNGPTVMINLGSHVVSDEKIAKEVAGAVRILLDYHDRNGSSKIQVLWKAKATGDARKVVDEIIGQEIKDDSVKVVAWLDAEPVSILQHPNLVCTVHHGGANSFYEGIWSGVPHVILSVWYDTYEFARRVEFLGVGVSGNKTCAPGARADEFGQALVRVTGNTEEGVNLRASAQRIKEICRTKGNGRELSAMAILKEAGVKG